VLATLIVAAAALAPPAPAAAPPEACHAEAVPPEKGPRRQAFLAWMAANAQALGEAAEAPESAELRIADVDNDGTDDYVLTRYQGSGGFLDLTVFRRAGDGFALVRESPLDDPIRGANDYFDPITRARQVLVRFCGRTYVTVLAGSGPNWSRLALAWQGGDVRPVCDAAWIGEQRAQFRRLYDAAHYDAAHGFLDGVEATCGKALDAQTRLWIQSDLALAAYHMGTFADCLEHVAAAETSPALESASAPLRRAVATNAGLCRSAKGTSAAVDLGWLLELERDPSRQVVLDPRFDRLLSAIVPDAKVEGEALRDLLKLNLYLPDPAQVSAHRYVVLSGCRPHDCENKGAAWIDTREKTSVVAVNGVVASTSFAATAIPAPAWRALSEVLGLPDGAEMMFVGGDGRTSEVKAPAREP
jgi:hypothetical protein